MTLKTMLRSLYFVAVGALVVAVISGAVLTYMLTLSRLFPEANKIDFFFVPISLVPFYFIGEGVVSEIKKRRARKRDVT